MRITRAGEYGLRAARYLGSNGNSKWHSINEISENQNVPLHFLSKVMQKLVKSGIVHSSSGKHGGYKLSKTPEEVTLKDIIISVEGDLTLNLCILSPEACVFLPDCKMHKIWEKVQSDFLIILGEYTLRDII
ncbi:MAG: Rrf2 family transcriptional regulator [Deltaproteobacteria bacterium]|nr:Rrf2 family transcriptional regulator [Deltaproteobacteria bacterium]